MDREQANTACFCDCRWIILSQALNINQKPDNLEQDGVLKTTRCQCLIPPGLRAAGGTDGGRTLQKLPVFAENLCFPYSVDGHIHTFTPGQAQGQRWGSGGAGARGCLSINLGVTTSRGTASHIPLLCFIFHSLSNET